MFDAVIRYEDLVAKKFELVEALLRTCGVPYKPVDEVGAMQRKERGWCEGFGKWGCEEETDILFSHELSISLSLSLFLSLVL